MKIYELVNVGNHLHLVVVLTKLSLYRKFIRTITALIARHVGQRNRGVGRATQSGKDKMENHFQFWLARPIHELLPGDEIGKYSEIHAEKSQ
ncbi:MAG: hypothetical protein IPK04_07830 [Bdellovibrionales bacterium]|nr:hypothetical protein [Bdellovibrionales bacterium]